METGDYSRFGRNSGGRHLGEVLTPWLQSDRTGALQWIESIESGFLAKKMRRIAGQAFIKMSEFELGLALIRPDLDEKAYYGNSGAYPILRRWIRKDRTAAIAWAEKKHLDKKIITGLILRNASDWAEDDWPAVEKWYDTLPDDLQSVAAWIG